MVGGRLSGAGRSRRESGADGRRLFLRTEKLAGVSGVRMQASTM